MGKIKDIFRGEHRKFAWFVVVLTSTFLILWLVGPGNTLIHWAGAALEQSRQEKQIRTYRKEINEMDRRIRMMRTDKDTLEKFAREQFGFSAPGEDVYIIEE
ncbi:MAG: septum formation initiator family protein [Bacteroidales bacterium]|nr:septum formation initiator family protein [Bacteroidales bacterium]